MVKTSLESIETTKWSESEQLKNTRKLKKAGGCKVKQKITLLAFIQMAAMLMNTLRWFRLSRMNTSLRDRKSEKCQEWALFTRVLIYHFVFPVSYPLHLTLTFTICSFPLIYLFILSPNNVELLCNWNLLRSFGIRPTYTRYRCILVSYLMHAIRRFSDVLSFHSLTAVI